MVSNPTRNSNLRNRDFPPKYMYTFVEEALFKYRKRNFKKKITEKWCAMCCSVFVIIMSQKSQIIVFATLWFVNFQGNNSKLANSYFN